MLKPKTLATILEQANMTVASGGEVARAALE
jgi:hypothetical protein